MGPLPLFQKGLQRPNLLNGLLGSLSKFDVYQSCPESGDVRYNRASIFLCSGWSRVVKRGRAVRGVRLLRTRISQNQAILRSKKRNWKQKMHQQNVVPEPMAGVDGVGDLSRCDRISSPTPAHQLEASEEVCEC